MCEQASITELIEELREFLNKEENLQVFQKLDECLEGFPKEKRQTLIKLLLLVSISKELSQ